MTDDERLVAKLEERSESQNGRIEKLELNQKWGVLTILGLIAKVVADYMNRGA